MKYFFIIVLFSTTGSFAQTDNYQSKKIAGSSLKSDFALLRDTLQKLQPSLYRYKSKAYIDNMFDSCYSAIKDSMTITDLYALTSFATAAIQDGHTNCRLPRQTMIDYISNIKVFPAVTMFMNNRAFILCCKQKGELTKTELLTINNHSVNEVIQQLFNYIPSDGSIQSRKNWELIESFPLLYNIVFGGKDSFNITYKTIKGDTKSTTLQADFIKNIICDNPFPRPDKYLSLSYTTNHVAILTIKTFLDDFLQQTGENFSQFLDSSFNDIKNKRIKKLILDIRNNQGGNDGNGTLLYTYFAKKPFKYYASQESTTEKFTVSGHPNLGLKYPKGNNFKGKVYFLTNGRSFSAAAEFASIAKSNNRGLFIGEETGGGYYGNTSGDEANVTLPNSQINCRIPMVKYTMAVKKANHKDRGVIPDYPIYITINDIVYSKDAQLNLAIKLAGK